MNTIVIIGGGHAAAPLCAALAEAGLATLVHLVCAEPALPYQRPPLSKAYLKNPAETLQPHRADSWYAQAGITLHRGDPAVAIHRTASTVTLQSGTVLPYGQLVLATGTRARRLPQLPATLANVAVLRDAADADRLRPVLAAARSLTVLGGGFIGLEVAATARAQGLEVQVIEAAPRLLGRSTSAELAAHVLATHQASGIQFHLGATVGSFLHDGQRLQAIRLGGAEGGQDLPVDLLLLGIGAEPEDSLARAAGLQCDNGIVVDAALRSSDPAILAIGDVARFPVSTRWVPAGLAGGLLRLESVQNATDQARAAALTLQGQSPNYAALPWFWSEQGGLRLQMAGLLPAAGTPGLASHRRPGATAASFSLLHYVGDRLLCVESVNAPMDHVMSRKLLEAGISPPPAVASDPAVALKSLLG